MASIFTRIVHGEIPCYRIAENERFLAFLDVRPLARGHTLVIPKEEVDYFFDLPDADLSAIMVFSRQIAKALGRAVPCVRIGVSVVGLEVPHAHVHLIPLNRIEDMHFGGRTLSFSPEEMEAIAAAIRAQLQQG